MVEHDGDSVPWSYAISDTASTPVTGTGVGGRSDLRTIERYGALVADVYAGTYVDGDVTCVGFTRDAEQHLTRLRAMTRTPLRTFAAAYTLIHLRQLQRRVEDDRALLDKAGIHVTLLGI